MSIKSKETHLVMFQFCVSYMHRPHCRVLEKMCRNAIWALKDARVEGDDFDRMIAMAILMSKSPPARRDELFNDLMDYMHDFLCREYPSRDDGERYWDEDEERKKRWQ